MASGGLTGILLVGGASRRFGSPKALARFDGETLAERAWRTLGAVCEERIAVGKSADALTLPFAISDDGTDVRAALAGVVAGLQAATRELCVVLPVDMPLVAPDLLRTLAAACARADAATPRAVPLPAALRRERMLPVLKRRLADGELSLRHAFSELRHAVVAADPGELENVNTEDDLAALARRARARSAAVEIGARFGLDVSRARVLSDWNDTIVHLAPTPLVARVATSVLRGDFSADVEETFATEIDVVRHAARRGAPVVLPSDDPPAGPHRAAGTVLSLWRFFDPRPGAVTTDEAAGALAALHAAIADYRGPLPPLARRLDSAQSVVHDPSALPALVEGDRRVLAGVFDELRRRVDEAGAPGRPIHGGAHDGNLLRTAGGVRWIDFDTACIGPAEWDVAHLPPAAAKHFAHAVDRDLLEQTRALVSAEVAIWCWRSYGRAPEVDEAAHFHLGRVRALAGARA